MFFDVPKYVFFIQLQARFLPYICEKKKAVLVESFELIYPTPALKPYVRHYWTLRTDVTDSVSERSIPTGCVSLIFHKANPIFLPGSGDFQPQSFVCGMSDGFTDLVARGGTEMIVVVFEPFGARAFFRMPLNKFYNEMVSVDDLDDLSLRELQARICDQSNNLHCIRLIEMYLIKKLHRFTDYNFRRMSAVVNVVNNRPQVDVNMLAGTACLGYKQFGRVFTEYVGARPKEFMRIIRFQRTLYLMQTQTDMNLTQLAFESGYYDQPHMIREFKTFSGYTPTELAGVCPPHSDYFSSL